MYKKYLITYANGVTQVKTLVPQEDFDALYIQKQTAISIKAKEKIQKQMDIKFGKAAFFFTSNSPLGKALTTGRLTTEYIDEVCTLSQINTP